MRKPMLLRELPSTIARACTRRTSAALDKRACVSRSGLRALMPASLTQLVMPNGSITALNRPTAAQSPNAAVTPIAITRHARATAGEYGSELEIEELRDLRKR